MIQIASKVGYYFWAFQTFVIGAGFILLVVVSVLTDEQPVKTEALLGVGLFLCAPGALSWFAYKRWRSLEHSVILDSGELKTESWGRSDAIPLPLNVCLKAEKIGFRICFLILEDGTGQTIARFVPRLEHYAEIKAHGPAKFWERLLSSPAAKESLGCKSTH